MTSLRGRSSLPRKMLREFLVPFNGWTDCRTPSRPELRENPHSIMVIVIYLTEVSRSIGDRWEKGTVGVLQYSEHEYLIKKRCDFEDTECGKISGSIWQMLGKSFTRVVISLVKWYYSCKTVVFFISYGNLGNLTWSSLFSNVAHERIRQLKYATH